jgi:pimeloyl-ACP methyl ester carboxylesterase
MAREIRGARQVSIPDCGHMAPLERPEAVSAALRDWLTWN